MSNQVKLFNQSMSAGTLPRDRLDYTANVIPIHKKGERCLVSNYRAISLTSVVVKVMGKIICTQLLSALEKSECITDNQFRIHTNYSTVTATLLLTAIHE